jgi:hypothetical protein
MLSRENLLASDFIANLWIFSQSAFGLCESRILQIVGPQNYSTNKRTFSMASHLLLRLASMIREATTMNATTTANGTKVGLNQVVEQVESTSAVRAAQSVLLSELPGMTFAFLTLAYVVLSLVGLA